MPLTAADVAEITRLLEESDFEELCLEQDGLRLTLRRGATAGPPTVSATAGASPRPAAPASRASALQQVGGESPQPDADASVAQVTAPLVGIFYRAARPGAPPYVEVGAMVEEDTIIGIIEVMKLMNAVHAEVKGTVREILVEDGAAVEYGQVLLRVVRGAQGG